ncbi:hypothetical protein C8Q80DRAFT_890032 [Daedaleopsis nitida]|nr:hypothetical protein C8Q80DRAFT_890032 [Daedaleopsis nitida]
MRYVLSGLSMPTRLHVLFRLFWTHLPPYRSTGTAPAGRTLRRRCLHIMTGAGVLEGWTHYIWHYVTVELPGRLQGAERAHEFPYLP